MLFLKCAVMYWNYLKLFLYQPPTNSTQFEMFIVLTKLQLHDFNMYKQNVVLIYSSQLFSIYIFVNEYICTPVCINV